ncbi:MAG: HlyD family efflux transporter periplasmic adaptor subunit [Bacillota bacterium]|nr:HlyD family efflux transporter periplasmic adaptor subunit [Bacillota bacterium]
MSRKKQEKKGHLKVIEGSGLGAGRETEWYKKNPTYLLLFLLAFFLLAQILIGWVWGTVNQKVIATVSASKEVVNMTSSTWGLITFDEEVILAPCPGFVYYHVEEGVRVPVGKELAAIMDFPLDEDEKEAEEKGVMEYYEEIKRWFLHGDRGMDYSPFFHRNEETVVAAPLAGLVNLQIDGFEKYGPTSGFPYLTEDEYQEKKFSEKRLESGEKVYRYMPLLRIMNNYYWYYSTVLSAEQGELLADKSTVNLYFSFAPETPVWGERVEVRERESNGDVEITWRINRSLPDFYSRRLSNADIVYKDIEGMLVPIDAVLEIDGKKGVFVVDKGLVSFLEVVIVMERENSILVENLNPDHRIVLKPESVREGQRF